MATESASVTKHAMAPEHLPFFLPGPDGSDPVLFNTGIFLIVMVLLIGVLYLSLHSLPEKMAHRVNHTQFQVVGILALVALFTHQNIFWVAAILLAAIQLPDFSAPMTSIARSLEKLSGREGEGLGPDSVRDAPDDGAEDTGAGSARKEA